MKKTNPWLILLLIVFLPLIFPILIATIMLAISLFLILISLIVIALILIIMGIVLSLCTIILLFIHFPTAIMTFGFSVLSISIGILIVIPSTKIAQTFMAFIVKKIKGGKI